MPIQTRRKTLATGIRCSFGIKVFGPDLATIEETAIEIERALQEDERTAPFTRSAFAERATGGCLLDFDIDRAAASRFGLNVGDVQDAIEAAMGGIEVGETVEGRERYGILLRYPRGLRGGCRRQRCMRQSGPRLTVHDRVLLVKRVIEYGLRPREAAGRRCQSPYSPNDLLATALKA